MIGWYIAVFVLASGGLLAGALWLITRNDNPSGPLWERPEFETCWHRISAWRDLYLCGKPRVYWNPSETADAPVHYGRMRPCKRCVLRANELDLAQHQ
jgi:hypothetical protein